MADLDSTFSNRVTFSDDDVLENESNSSAQESEDEEKLPEVSSSKSPYVDKLSTRVTGNQTGPKGVLADYKYLKSLANQPKPNHAKPKESPNFTSEKDQDEELSDWEKELEKEAEKLQIDRNLAKVEHRKGSIENGHLKFGKVVQLTFSTYNEAVDKADPQTTVIIHLYETYIDDCVKVHESFKTLSQKYLKVKFCEMVASNTGSQFDEVALPAILVYQAGKLLVNLTPFTSNLQPGQQLDATSIEAVLKRFNVQLNVSQF